MTTLRSSLWLVAFVATITTTNAFVVVTPRATTSTSTITTHSTVPHSQSFATRLYESSTDTETEVDAFDAYQMQSPSQKLATRDIIVGTGDAIQPNDILKVEYSGKLMATGESFGEGQFEFQYGASSGVIKGWDQGIAGMNVGGKRMLKIPPSLGYGAKGAGKKIPPNSDLEFEVEILSKSEGAVAEFLYKTGLGLNVRTGGMLFFLGVLAVTPMLQ